MQLNRLADVGECIFTQSLSSVGLVGTPRYIAPEIILKQPYDQRVDIWSLGCVLYELSSLKPAFDGESYNELFDNIVSKSPKPIPPYAFYFD
jgi:NIMA (never in mitosis gene a)-related kinase